MPKRHEIKLGKMDINKGDILLDRVYDDCVEVMEVNVGNVLLKYPHHNLNESCTYRWPLDGRRFRVKETYTP